MGLSPKPVMDAMIKRIHRVNSTGVYSGTEGAARNGVAALLGTDPSEIAFTHNVTEGINIAVWSLNLKKDDEVILTDQEHVGNALPWLNRKENDGIRIKVISIPDTAEACLEEIKKAITPRTKVIAVPHVTCTTGQVLPIKEICALAREKGIKTMIDGAHGVGMLKLNLHDIGCDVYSSCGHKWMLGPKGTGLLYARKDLIQELRPMFVGGHSSKEWVVSTEEISLEGFQEDAHRFYYGTQNSALYSGITAAIDFIHSVGNERIEARIRELNELLYSELASMSDIRLVTPKEKQSRCGMASFVLTGRDTKEVYSKMRNDGWTIRFVPESNQNCIRVSTHIYNSEKQIEQFLNALKGELS